jgi:hypothetical protein
MGEIGIDDVKRGDILLVTQHPTSPLAEMIVEYDRSPDRFSHSGVAGGEGTIISAFPTRIRPTIPVAVEGLTYEHFSHFWERGQSIHRLVLPAGVDRAAALRRLDDYPPDRRTTFGVASIVMVAAALHALNHEDAIGGEGTANIVSQAIAAGNAWTSDTEFFCAEFAAVVYDLASWPFTVADLRPPQPAVRERGVVTDVVIAVGLQALIAGRTPTQQKTLKDFVAVVQEYDPDFFEEGLEVVGREVLGSLGVRIRDQIVDEKAVVPAALITPRMLAAWGEGTELVRRS